MQRAQQEWGLCIPDCLLPDFVLCSDSSRCMQEPGAVDATWFQDPSFVAELLGGLPGVDINDPRIQNALKEVGGDEKKDFCRRRIGRISRYSIDEL